MVILMGSVAELPTRICPKSRETGDRTSVGGAAVPKRRMKSSGLEESEMISSASMTWEIAWEDDACGVKVIVMGQLAPGTMLGQEPVTVKSGVVARPVRWRVVVPVLENVTVCEFAEVEVTTSALGKSSAAGVIVRLGLAVEPPTPGCGMVRPVRRTLAPWSSESVTESPEVCGEL